MLSIFRQNTKHFFDKNGSTIESLSLSVRTSVAGYIWYRKKNFYATFAKFTTLVTLCKWCNERADIVIRFDLGVQFAWGPQWLRGAMKRS